MHSLVAHFSGRFTEWIRPASLLWLAAESEQYGAPWWVLTRDRRDGTAFVAEIRQLASQSIDPSVPWHAVFVLDAEEVERDAGIGLMGWLSSIQSLSHQPRQITLLMVGAGGVSGLQPSVEIEAPTGTAPSANEAARTAWRAMEASLHDTVAASAREGAVPTRLVIVTAHDLLALDSLERKVLAANLLLLLARHPHVLPRGFVAGRLVHFNPLLAGPNGSQVDLGSLAIATHAMDRQIDTYLREADRSDRVEVYPLPHPHVSTLPLYTPIESPKPRVTRTSWFPLHSPDASGFERVVEWREKVLTPASAAVTAVIDAADAAERASLDALRFDATTQPAPSADLGRNPDVRSVVMDRQELRGFREVTSQRITSANLSPTTSVGDVPKVSEWEGAFADFRGAAASRATWPTVLAVNAILALAIVALGWSFAEATVTLTVVLGALVAFNVLALTPILARLHATAQRLEALRARVNQAIVDTWRHREAQSLERERYFVATVNLRHVDQALAISASRTLGAETSTAWIDEELRPESTRLVRSLRRNDVPEASAAFVTDVVHGVPMPLQPLVHLHNYRSEPRLAPATLRIDRGLDGGGQRIDVDPLLWTLQTLELSTDAEYDVPNQWRERLEQDERTDPA